MHKPSDGNGETGREPQHGNGARSLLLYQGCTAMLAQIASSLAPRTV